LVFDNAEDIKLLNTWWPKGKNGAILITSRDPIFETSSGAGNGQQLKAMDEKLALEMLRSQLPDEVEFGKEEALKIVRRVQCLPLGIQACVGVINEARCSLGDFNLQWSAPKALLEEAFAPYENGGLGDVWKLALLKIDNESRAMIEVFSLLDPDNIQERIFVVGNHSLPMNNVEYLQNRVKCIKTLLKGLVQPNTAVQGTHLRSFHMHRLLQTCVQMEMSPESLQDAFNSAITLVCGMMSPLWNTTWPKIHMDYKEYFTHVQTIRRYYLEMSEEESKCPLTIPINFLELLRLGAG
jgi:hypothetical protein